MIVFYDGECRFCRANKEYWEKKDELGLIVWEDISSPFFIPEVFGLGLINFHDDIHALIGEELIHGYDVVCEIMDVCGLHKTAAFISLPGIRFIGNIVWKFVSKVRRVFG